MNDAANRPYFNLSIEELEAIVARSRDDSVVLDAVLHELRHRERPRALRLRQEVEQIRASLVGRPHPAAETAQSPSHASTEAELPGSPPAPRPQDHPATVNFGELPRLPRPEQQNQPLSILAAWTALEALSPRTYRRPENLINGDQQSVANISRGRLPWDAGETSRRKNRKLFYHVVLGGIAMDKATDALVQAFGDDDERPSRAREMAAIASIIVDRRGIPLAENAVSVSSFAWGLPLALKLRFDALGAWPNVERKVIEKIEELIRRVDDQGNPLPLDIATITAVHQWLAQQFALPRELVQPPHFALRVYHWYRAPKPPEPLLLNSFFLGDLARCTALVARKEAPPALRRYLDIDMHRETFDLLTDRATLETAVAPRMTPPARWPSPGGFPLVLLQQAAVNLVRHELSESAGLFAVNGPPGTGKTTLLRDLVASCVLDRAMAMAAFDDPATAFKASGVTVRAGENAFFHLYALHPSLKGHEVLVASSNNKAVENVSKELPAAKAVGRGPTELRYFKSVSDLLHGPREADGEDDASPAPEPVETWGLIASVLGNRGNLAAFQRRFWWHEDLAFRLYLKAAKGDSVVREIRDPDTNEIIERRLPAIIGLEQPPSPQMARANWQKARARLQAAKREVDQDIAVADALRKLCLEQAAAERAIGPLETGLAEARLAQMHAASANRASHEALVAAAQIAQLANARQAQHRSIRPGFWSRLFRTKAAQAWKADHKVFASELKQAEAKQRDAENAHDRSAMELSAAKEAAEAGLTALAAMKSKVADFGRQIEAASAGYSDRLVNTALFKHGHDHVQLTAPWFPDSAHRKREDLFIAAMEVHRAFIDAAAQKVLHNLSILMDAFSNGASDAPNRRALAGELWSTLFMVSPVVSTTFASVERMLGDIAPESLGWLLIDEAGQATPQAAVGAMMRTRRTITVGDPLQIPPVVSLPERLNAGICDHFRIDMPIWSAPEASTQTLADRASRYQASFRTDTAPRRVGAPLLVHRRCQDPMFSISNQIAYDGQMVYAAGACAPGPIGDLLGPSQWFDVDGDASSKWCPAEGERIVKILHRLADGGVSDPDLFLITPFRIVAQELRRRLESERALFQRLQIDAQTWLKDRVGTIHTVQGREANTVFLVLGAPMAAQHGARAWATATPNILNVAVSRAKQNLYVIGSHAAWSGVGYAAALSCLPRTNTG